jgi:hypothetical protein
MTVQLIGPKIKPAMGPTDKRESEMSKNNEK